MVQTVCRTTGIPQFFFDKVINALLCNACRSSTYCRGEEAGSHGPVAGHSGSMVPVALVVDLPRTSSTWAVV